MSRHLRRVLGPMSLPPAEDSDGDFDPNYYHSSNNSALLQLIAISSSESEHEVPEVESDEETPSASNCKKNKKQQKKLTKKKEVKNKVDEVERYVSEVNTLLGAPPEPSTSNAKMSKQQSLMKVQQVYLNSEREKVKLTGPESHEDKLKRLKVVEKVSKCRIENMIVSYSLAELKTVSNCGLSMSIHERRDNLIYFIYNHNEKYQNVHRKLINDTKEYNIDILGIILKSLLGIIHAEELLEQVDCLFFDEENEPAVSHLEKAIICLQCNAHPGFSLTNPNVRLEYKYLENRPFHVAVFKYIYILSNRACDRTAFNLGKLLISLDPTDPLLVYMIIDTLALRAKQYQWFIDFYEAYKEEGHKFPELLVNLDFSYALSKFLLAVKKKESTDEADKLLQNALVCCPVMGKWILAKVREVYKENADKDRIYENMWPGRIAENFLSTTKTMAEIVGAIWQVFKPRKWFVKNMIHVVETHSPEAEAIYRRCEEARLYLYLNFPPEPIRHMSVIQAMSKFVVEGVLPPIKRSRAYNPIPPVGTIDRYKYNSRPNPLDEDSIWFRFISSAIYLDEHEQ